MELTKDEAIFILACINNIQFTGPRRELRATLDQADALEAKLAEFIKSELEEQEQD